MKIERFEAPHRDAVRSMARECGAFTEQEVAVCLEIADTVVARPEQRDYEIWVALDPDPVGFIIFGTNALSDRVWELYWIVSRRPGTGTELMKFMEGRIAREARMCVLETSGQPKYDAQRRFYAKMGFREVARVADFYREGDDLLIYRKDYSPIWSEGYGRVAEAARRGDQQRTETEGALSRD